MSASDLPSRDILESLSSAGSKTVVQLPASATTAAVAFFGLAGFVAAAVLVPNSRLPAAAQAMLILGMTALPMLLIDFLVVKVHRRSSTGLDWCRAPNFSLRRSSVKILGLSSTLAILAALYWLFPEYHDKSYTLFFDLLAATWPYAVGFTCVYIFIIDAYMVDPKDSYWQAGCVVLGRLNEINSRALGQHWLGWAVKGFFIPFMLSNFFANIDAIYGSVFLKGDRGFGPFYEFCYASLYAVDVAFGTLGYLLTFRIADTHIRSTEPTALGWLVALACYPPFWPQLYQHFLPYETNAIYWGDWLRSQPILYGCWAAAILCCVAIYAWGTVTFGCRFSNLTHRGILTNGPYRWTKHPAYLAKNVSWWLVAVPFVSGGGGSDALRACLMLGLVNLLYFLRARTEERHLSLDPTYVTYALWINEHGIFNWLGKAVPVLRYKQPAWLK